MFKTAHLLIFNWISCSWRLFYKSVFGVLGLLALQACTKENFIPEEGVRAHLPLYQPGRDYELQEVKIHTLSDLSNIRGEASEFYYSPRIQGNHQFDGIRPVLRFFYDSANKVVPTDAMSLRLLTLYYHFENLMFWDRKTGVAATMSYPRQVAVEARTRDESGALSANNARYFTLGDSCLFETYTLASLPTVVNSGVIAHEHFHAIFQRAVLQGVKPQFLPPDQASYPQSMSAEDQPIRIRRGRSSIEMTQAEFNLYHQWALRAVNEGLADVWGWLYSKDRSFVVRSIPGQQFRTLSAPRRSLSNEGFRQSILFGGATRPRRTTQMAQQRSMVAYQQASVIAGALAQAARVHYQADHLNEAQTLEFSKWILEALPQFKAEVNASEQQLFSLGRILSLIFSKERESEFSAETCEVIRDVLTDRQDLSQLCHSPVRSATSYEEAPTEASASSQPSVPATVSPEQSPEQQEPPQAQKNLEHRDIDPFEEEEQARLLDL